MRLLANCHQATSILGLTSKLLLRRSFSATSFIAITSTNSKMTTSDGSFKPLPGPSVHVSAQSKDVWSIINEAAASVESTGKKVVNLGQGFFSYSPPDFAIEAAKKALDVPALNQYSPTRGRPSLRKALADSYSPFFNRTLDPESEIVVTAGANQGMYAAFTAFINPGDEVIVFEPFFDQYISNIQLPGGKVVYVPLHPPSDAATRTSSAGEWKIDFDELKAAVTEKTRIIVLNTPQNPTGKVFSREELEKIGQIAVEHNIIILSDEVYDRLYYTPFVRIATLSPELARLTLTVGSAGKTFSATGWRVGWLIGHPDLIKYVAAANTRIVFTVNSPLQEATAKALVQAETNTYYHDNIVSFEKKYKIFNAIWDELGLPYTVPEGGYFVLVNFAKVQVPEDYEFPPEVTHGKAKDFRTAYWLIKEIGVVAIPPTEFYTPQNAHLAEEFLRFAVCKDDHILEEAVEKLRALKKYIKS
ncbi:Bna3p [Sugiyamaella lignohabitans]|uniref:Bna3p n=1 Tax=Sugiyamaella lignohabitans TaxID=796027 RepID=A0A167DJR6_9ASCO|nr:Bna3p [Sugiyamaella lignohabitans]ANB12990.1 Bna3p [Sugiyamaella lignohabitans]